MSKLTLEACYCCSDLGKFSWQCALEERVHLERNVHGAKQGELQVLWGMGFKMILIHWMKSEINWVESSNDQYEVFCPGDAGRERVDRSSRAGRS